MLLFSSSSKQVVVLCDEPLFLNREYVELG